MKKLLRNPLFLFIFGAIAATLIGYLINQLPNIPNFPYKTEILFAAVFIFTILTALVAYQQAQQQPEDAPADIDPTIRPRLLEAEGTKVKQRLRDSLHHLLMLDLRREEQPQQVGRKPLQTLYTVSVNNTTSQPKVLDQMVDVLRREDVGGRLLILGKPGSGKTTTLLDLAKELLERANNNDSEPIPIIFELSAWRDDSVDILDWLMIQLKEEYNLAPGISRFCLERGEVLPLLDGLDELGLEKQRKCIQAINQYLAEDATRDLVVCCREEEYIAGKEQLAELHGAVCLQPLSNKQIQNYLEVFGRGDLWQSIENNPEFLELAKTPLFLSMMVVAYQGQAIQTKEELFDAYIERIFELNPVNKREIQRRKTMSLLKFLAKRLKERQTEFSIENMQPNWLQNIQQRLFYRLIFGLISGLSYALISGLISGLIYALISGLIVRLYKIETVEEIRFSFKPEKRKIIIKNLIREVITGLILGLIVGLIIGLVSGLFFRFVNREWLIFALIYRLIFGLIYGLIYGLIFGLIFGLKDEIVNKSFPNQGIWYSAKNMLVLPVLFGLIFLFGKVWLKKSLLSTLLIGVHEVDIILKLSQFMLVFLGFFFGGGLACIQHFSLRLVLWHNGYIPWNYAKFLDRAAERRIIQKVGGSYRFIHRLLLDHFADIPISTSSLK